MEPIVCEDRPPDLAAYARVSIAFTVRSRLRAEGSLGGRSPPRLVEETVDPPWEKDYDRSAGEGPLRWARRWDLASWGVFVARHAGLRLGGAVVARHTPGVDVLEGRDDLSVLWDLRVGPAHRGRGVGRALFEAAAAWAAARGDRELRVETQDINVAACHFYAARGCRLLRIEADAYPDLPGEARWWWGLALSHRRA